MGNFFKGIVKNRTMLILFLAVSALVVLNLLLPEDPSAPHETTRRQALRQRKRALTPELSAYRS